MNVSHKHYAEQKQPTLQSSYVWFYFYKVQNMQLKAELICGDRSQDSGYFGGGCIAPGRGNKVIFCCMFMTYTAVYTFYFNIGTY